MRWSPLFASSIAAAADLLFMDTADVFDAWGLLLPTSNPVQPDARFVPPPGAPFAQGAVAVGVLPSLSARGTWEVYVENATGWEPLDANAAAGRAGAGADADADVHARKHPTPAPPDPRMAGVDLVRYETRDFVRWSAGATVLHLPTDTDGASSLKSLARNDATGRYVLFASFDGYATYISTDEGGSWVRSNCTSGCVRKPDKDDLNIIYSRADGCFVDLQITWRQNVSMRYCDSDPCDQARAVSVKTSTDGVDWRGNSSDLLLPDPVLDPPDLQFYRVRPFTLGSSGRLAAHALLYAPAPPVAVVGAAYGRQPQRCKAGPPGYGDVCHGPHIGEEWWLGPPSGKAADLHGWRRPFRQQRAAPNDAFLMAPPVTVNGSHVWLDSGRYYSLPLYRLAGLRSPSNAEFSSAPFVVPAAAPVALNADARWNGRLVTGGCDEGCSAYVFVELLDAVTGAVLPGFDRVRFDTIVDANGPRLPLRWRVDAANASDASQDSSALAGRRVRARIGLRDATVYALMLQ